MTGRSTYRAGGSWGVTIVRQGAGPADAQGRREGDALVAVVMNGAVVTGDRDLAERVCALLNADDSAEPVEHEITTIGEPHRTFLGPDGAIRTEPHGEACDCGHEGLDEMFHLAPCPIAMRRLAKRRGGR